MSIRDEIKKLSASRHPGEFLHLQKFDLGEGTDLSNLDLSYIDFTDATGENINFSNSDLSHSIFIGSRFEHSNFENAKLNYANLQRCDMRYSNFHKADCRGTIFGWTVMECSNHEGIIIDDTTKNFRMACPEKGAFVAYKKCFGDLLVQLLVPADARRGSGTTRACRCDKAKVLNITNFDHTEKFDVAQSLCGREFYYHLGEYVYEPKFNEDRFLESSYGIHFWLTEEEAIAY